MGSATQKPQGMTWKMNPLSLEEDIKCGNGISNESQDSEISAQEESLEETNHKKSRS